MGGAEKGGRDYKSLLIIVWTKDYCIKKNI